MSHSIYYVTVMSLFTSASSSSQLHTCGYQWHSQGGTWVHAPCRSWNFFQSTGHAKKVIPEEKFDISGIVADFFAKFTAFTDEDSGHISSKFY